MVDFRQALRAGNAVAFEQEPENRLSLLNGQVHAIKCVVTGVREHLAALGALVALAITALPELPAVGTAIVTRHFGVAFRGQPVLNDSGYSIPVPVAALPEDAPCR